MAILNNHCTQQGFTLIEGLISIVLMGLVGLGIAYNLSRTLFASGRVMAQSVSVNEIRGQLQSSGVASNCSSLGTSSQVSVTLASAASTTLTRQCSYTAMTLVISGAASAGQTVVHPQLSYTGNDSRLGAVSLALSN